MKSRCGAVQNYWPVLRPLAHPARPRTTASGCSRCAGRSSDSRAAKLGSRVELQPRLLLAVASQQNVSACDGGRSRLPLRGSSGVTPDSLLAPLWLRGEPAAMPRLPLHLVVGDQGGPSGCVVATWGAKTRESGCLAGASAGLPDHLSDSQWGASRRGFPVWRHEPVGWLAAARAPESA